MIWLASFLYLICCTLAFAYGAHVSFNKGGVLFLQVITCAFGCFTLGSVYDLCYFLCIGEYKNGFGIGDLGYIGGMTFLFSSYYGAMDRIGDSGSKSLIKFRIIACIPGVLNAFFMK